MKKRSLRAKRAPAPVAKTAADRKPSQLEVDVMGDAITAYVHARSARTSVTH